MSKKKKEWCGVEGATPKDEADGIVGTGFEYGRVGKIGRLSKGVREELNRRIRLEKERYIDMLRWLNSLPEAKEVCAKFFGGKPINAANLSQWKDWGYEEWLRREDYREMMATLAEASREMTELSGEAPESIGDRLAMALSARYADMLTSGERADTEYLQRRLEVLGQICNDITKLRRGDHALARLKLSRARFKWVTTCGDRRAQAEERKAEVRQN